MCGISPCDRTALFDVTVLRNDRENHHMYPHHESYRQSSDAMTSRMLDTILALGTNMTWPDEVVNVGTWRCLFR
jgi:hypothetical protein